jgi:phosphate transport system substrate-binding protein
MNCSKLSLIAVFCILACIVCPVFTLSAQEVRFHGSSTVTVMVMDPAKEAIAKATGLQVVVVGNGTENGLDDLIKGRCSAAMASEELAEAVANLKKVQPDLSIPSNLQAHVITHDVIAVIVHPKNPVTKLSKDQVKGLMTGSIQNWKEVGSMDSPVTIVTSNPGSGTRKTFQKMAMDDAKYSKEAIEAARTDEELKLVSEYPEAIGSVSAGMAKIAEAAGKVKIVDTPQFGRPLLIATIGEPSPSVKKVIDFLKGDGQKLFK